MLNPHPQSTPRVLAPLRFPQDIFHLLYWIFLKPMTLDRYIRQFGPDLGMYTGFFTLWRRGKEHPELRAFVGLGLCAILFSTWLAAFLVTAYGALAGFEVSWAHMAASTSGGMIYGLLAGWANGGIVAAMVGAAALGGMNGMIFGVPRGWKSSTDYMAAYDLLFGATLGTISGLAFSVFAPSFGKWAGRLGWLVMAFGLLFVFMRGISPVAAFIILFWISYCRLPLYLFELPISLFLGWRGARLQHSPVYWDELIWLPLWGLDRQIVRLARRDRPAALAAVSQVAQSFRQGWAAQVALLELTADDIEQAQTPAAIAALAPIWAGAPDNPPSKWTGFQQTLGEIADNAHTALASNTPTQRQAQFRQALEGTRQLRQSFRWSRRFAAALQVWEGIFEREGFSSFAPGERIAE